MKKKKSVEQIFRSKLAVKWDRIDVPTFLGMSRNTECHCRCGHVFTTTPKKLLRSGCAKCVETEKTLLRWKSVTKSMLNTMVGERLLNVKVLARNTSKPMIRVKCLSCGHMWQSNAHALITNLGQCPVEYRAQYSKTLHIQPHKGYTYEGMDSVPSIAYRYHGQTWALDAHCRSTKKEKELLYLLNITDVHEIKKLQAAKAACTAAGFKLNLCVFNQTDKTTQIVQNWTYLDEEQVRQYLRRGDLSTVRVLSMDPGVNNYAWSVIEIKRPFEIKILASGMMTHTLTDLVGSTVHQETLLFKQEVNQIMTDYDPQFLIAERYMSRGMGGSTIELVNIMIGILASMWTHSSDRILFIPAAQWKNEFNKVVVDEQRTTLEHMYGKSKVTEHQIDSTCIGLYGAARWLDEKITTWVKKIVTVVPKQIDRVGLR